MNESSLPYIVVAAVFDEASVIKQLIHNLEKLGNPDDGYRGPVIYIIVLEEDDRETIEAVKRYKKSLADNWHVLIVPDGVGPQTKPRGLNVALHYMKEVLLITKGYLTVYDAEDRPDSDQLKKAANILSHSDKSVAALQARLVITNDTGGFLQVFTKGKIWSVLFSIAYELHFTLILPLLSQVGFVPLGGTSFHMRIEDILEIGGWDAWNPTEDLYLAYDLALLRRKTLLLNSVTREDAPTRIKPRLRQLSRWGKGYDVTWLIFWKKPLRSVVKMGLVRSMVFIAFVGGAVTLPILSVGLWLLTFAYYFTRSEFIESLFPPLVYALGMSLLIVGNLGVMFACLMAVMKANKPYLVKWVILLIPLHWILISIAALRACKQVMTGNAHIWEKTPHEPCSEETELPYEVQTVSELNGKERILSINGMGD